MVNSKPFKNESPKTATATEQGELQVGPIRDVKNQQQGLILEGENRDIKWKRRSAWDRV